MRRARNEEVFMGEHVEKEYNKPLGKGIITKATFANVRKTPEQTSEVLIILNRGDQFDILQVVNGYYKIKVGDGEYGYISLSVCDTDLNGVAI